jgi:RimJ/RimL family protein N-acetyltransferase
MTEDSVSLRQWRESDFDRFAEMNADLDVMRYFLAPQSRDESRIAFDRVRRAIDEVGWGLWAVEVGGEFAGLTGLSRPSFTAHFTPCVEVGWRFRREYWGKGVATIAARKAEAFAFSNLKLAEIVSFTTETNFPSRRLMERLGFQRNPLDDFEHPLVPFDHPLLPHVLYRKKANQVPDIVPDSKSNPSTFGHGSL